MRNVFNLLRSIYKIHTVIPCFVVFCFIVLHTCWLLTKWKFVVTLSELGQSVPFTNSLCSLHMFELRLGDLEMFQIFSLLLYFLWWSVISDLWCYYFKLWGCTRTPHPYKMVNLINKYMWSNCSINWLFPCLSSIPQISPFPEA